jgi:DNA-binding NarL/FixJ family response regulator
VVRALEGDRRVNMSTVAVDDGERQLFLHVMVSHEERAPPEPDVVTPRQLEILQLLADGVHAKVIATRLGVAEATVRNHIRGVLVALGAHSQLEAIAMARRRQIVD